ncbi:MAG: oligosaccharide flippase family protein [Chitinophagaceae bacterium]|nr:oligosaccharide flippase family protein [Chitinophagaceae bacterium]
MIQKKFFRDLSATTLQVVFNQFFGLLIFYLLSRLLDKSDFGELNWSVAVTWVATTILSFGTDVLIVKRIADGNDAGRMGGLHISHTLLAALVFSLVVLVSRLCFPVFFRQHYLLIAVSVSALVTFFSSPFKQVANGREAFRNLAVMTVMGNLAKAFLLSLAALLHLFTIRNVVGIYIIASMAEWATGAWLIFKQMGRPLRPHWDSSSYSALLKESLPQLGVILFDSALARVDWIILGLVKGPASIAEYSFAYKIFEISRLPMLVLGPLILPKFVRYFNDNGGLLSTKKDELRLLLKIEIAIAVLIPLFFNITWTPLIGWITAGKYGAVDAPIYMLLSFCVPLHYINNFLWTMAFAQKQLKLTFYITIVVSVLNLVLNLLLIPALSTQGAAIAFVISTIVQLLLYKFFVNQQQLSVPLAPLFLSIGIAAACLYISWSVCQNLAGKLLLGIGGYMLLLFFTGMLRISDIRKVGLVLTK